MTATTSCVTTVQGLFPSQTDHGPPKKMHGLLLEGDGTPTQNHRQPRTSELHLPFYLLLNHFGEPSSGGALGLF